MSMVHTKEFLTIPPEGVLKGLNTSFAAAILRVRTGPAPSHRNSVTAQIIQGAEVSLWFYLEIHSLMRFLDLRKTMI